jgi:hypothetical protein
MPNGDSKKPYKRPDEYLQEAIEAGLGFFDFPRQGLFGGDDEPGPTYRDPFLEFKFQLEQLHGLEELEHITEEQWAAIEVEFNRQAYENGLPKEQWEKDWANDLEPDELAPEATLTDEREKGPGGGEENTKAIRDWVKKFLVGTYWTTISGVQLQLAPKDEQAIAAFGDDDEEVVYDEMHKAIAAALGLEPGDMSKPTQTSEGVWAVFAGFGEQRTPHYVRQVPDGNWVQTYPGYEVTGDKPNYIRIGVNSDGYVILAPDDDPTKTIVTEILDQDYLLRLRDSELSRDQYNFLIASDAANRRADAIQTNFRNELDLAEGKINAWNLKAGQEYNEASFNADEMYRAATQARANREFEVSTRLEALAQQEQSRATNIQAGFQLAQIRQNSIDQVRDILRSPSDIVASGFALAGEQVPGATVTQADLVNGVRNEYNAYEDYLRTFGTGFNAAQFMASIPAADAYTPQAFGFTEPQPGLPDSPEEVEPWKYKKPLPTGETKLAPTAPTAPILTPEERASRAAQVRDRAIFGPGGPNVGADPQPVVPPGSVPRTIDPNMTPDEQIIHEGQIRSIEASGMQPNVRGFELQPMPYITRPGEPPPHRAEPMPYITRPDVPPQWQEDYLRTPVPMPGPRQYVPPPPRYEGAENLPYIPGQDDSRHVYLRGGGVTGFGNPVVVGDSGNGRENQELVMSLGGAPVVVLPMTDRQEDIMASASGRVPQAQFGGGYGFNDFSMDDVVGFGRNITGLGGGTLSQAGGFSGLLDREDRVTQSEILGMAKQRTPPRVQAFLRGDPEPLKQRYFDRPGLFPSGMPTPGMYASLSPSEKEMLRTRLLMETPDVLLEDVEADIAARYGPTYARRGKRVF